MRVDTNKYTNKQRSVRWLLYTAMPSVFLYLLAVIYDMLLGYKIPQCISNHFLEFILMVFAIAISILGTTLSVENNISPKKKEVYAGFSIICCFICFVFYGFLYRRDDKNIEAVNILQLFFILISIIIIFIGMKLEYQSNDADNEMEQ